jgi:hypothetical protein
MSHPIRPSRDRPPSIVASLNEGDVIAGPVEHDSGIVLRAGRPPLTSRNSF